MTYFAPAASYCPPGLLGCDLSFPLFGEKELDWAFLPSSLIVANKPSKGRWREVETQGETRVLCFPDLATGCGDECEGLPPLRRLLPLGVRGRVLSSVVLPQVPHSCSEEATPRVAEWK